MEQSERKPWCISRMPVRVEYVVSYDRSVFKGSGHYWYLLKKIISIRPYLVMSTVERLVV